MTDDDRGYAAEFDPDDVIAEDELATPDQETVPPQYGVGPFSIREVVLGGIWLLAFVFSFFPLYAAGPFGPSVWTGGLDWILTIAVPTAAVFLLGLRRLSPDGIRRVGSLGIDQFASVAFTVSAVFWLGTLWRLLAGLPAGLYGTTWVVWLELLLMLGGVFFTVFAPLVPVIRDDFRHRPEVLAHPLARPQRPVVARPSRPAPAYVAPAAADATETAVFEPVVVEAQAPQHHAPQAFWALAPEERDVLDETGAPLFRIGPTAWALVIEDRGAVFVVRHEDGRLGYLHDVTGVTRG